MSIRAKGGIFSSNLIVSISGRVNRKVFCERVFLLSNDRILKKRYTGFGGISFFIISEKSGLREKKSVGGISFYLMLTDRG
jgi:hypothetical protein